MKTIVAIFVTVVTLSFNANSQDKKVQAILDSPEQRTEVFNAILNNHELMMEFMTAMKGNEHASMMMKNNQMGMMQSKESGNAMHQNHNMMMKKDECNMEGSKATESNTGAMSCCSSKEEVKTQNVMPKHKHK